MANALITSLSLLKMVNKTETVLDSQVTKEPVTQVVEIGAPITHKGMKVALLQLPKRNQRLDIQEEEIRSLLWHVKIHSCSREDSSHY